MEKRSDLWPSRDVVQPGQESVWDFPRPPRIESVSAEIRVEFAGCVIGASRRALRVLETSLPPGYYLPPDDIDSDRLAASDRRTHCEWKGWADYYDVIVSGDSAADSAACAAWTYPEPVANFQELAGFFSFYPALVSCFVGGEKVMAQPGGFYGGWITSALAGPFKGAPGSEMW